MREAHAPAAPGVRDDREAAVTQALDVTRHRPGRDAEVAGEVGDPEAGAVGGVQPLDDRLLALDPAQGEVVVAGRCREDVPGRTHDPRLEHVIGVSGSVPTVSAMTDTHTVGGLFAAYAQALLARDEQAVADLYAVPSLILFPGTSIPVTDAAQTAAFFASSWPQYEGVDTADPSITVMAEGPVGVWADVTWDHGAGPAERFCYQLVAGPDGYRIAVLTLLDLPG